MRIAFWIAAAVVVYTYAGYPICVAALARLVPRPWRQGAIAGRLSVIMAVHNGATMLPWKLDQLLHLAPDLVHEIIVVSDGSTDDTNAILTRHSDPRLHTIVVPEQAGKASALNHALTVATGDILLFTDIRPRISSSAVHALVSNFADPKVGCVAGELVVEAGPGSAPTTAAVGNLYWRYEQWMRNCESLFDSPVGVYGGFYATRRSLVMPFPEGLILDDMFQPLSVIRKGYRSVVDTRAVVTDTWPASTAHEFARKVRTLTGNFQLVARAPWLLTGRNRVLWQLVSHKLLRLIVPWMLTLMLVSSLVLARNSATWAAVAASQVALWCASVTSLYVRIPVVHRLAAAAGALLVLNAAAVAALYRFLFTTGPLWRTWTPTAALVRPPFTMHEEQEHA